MLIIDGVSDDPLPELKGYTPLETAVTPGMEYLASKARKGTIQTVFEGYPVESLVCIMGLLGYDPRKYYPCGRASFEAMARGIGVGENDLVFRCNIIKAAKNREYIADFTAGMISDACAKNILSEINLPSPAWELYPGQSYRNLMLVRQTPVKANEIKFFEPHMHQCEPLENLLPAAATKQAETLASELRDFLLRSYEQIASMDVTPDCEGNMLWLWSASSKPRLPAFKNLYGISGAVVAGLDFMRGLAIAADMYFEVIPGATGYIDTDYRAKAEATIRMLDKHDFVLTHVNAADEAAHIRDAAQKIDAIESVDRYILEPVFSHLRQSFPENFAVIVCGDHKTRCSDGKHAGDPTPFLFYLDGETPQEVYKDYRNVPSLRFLKEVFGLC
ncbi:MAG: 2,3-bisphosphoglycerate-independent phosphoglycerate mutase [Synergistaceae bacterium]|nr:2,3-bisphosphoglycerate-independent phosphoglycerate mutase [Synergistaceae bacterium]